MGAEQMRLALLANLREEFPEWSFTYRGAGPLHPWEAKRTLIHELGGYTTIRAADAELLREMLLEARIIDARFSGQRS